jgi:ubiquinone/menaquinone biosynthesis C-methylase UbiE
MATASSLAQLHWNKTPLYLTEQERYQRYPWLYAVAEFADHANQRVLEVGCGTGCDLMQFAKHGAAATGVDITDAHLELAHQRVGNLAKVIKSDMCALPFPDGAFDYVYSHGVLHHCDEPEKAAKEILRVLRPGGRLNVHVYALYSYTFLWNITHFGRDWNRVIENNELPVHIDLYTARKVRKLFQPIPLTVRKFELPSPTFRRLEPWLGWYLVATGTV